jgi:hypothetical protein
MNLYKDFIINNFSFTPSSDNIVLQEMLVKDDYLGIRYLCYIVTLSHHSKYNIQAKIIIYKGVMQSEDDIPQILTTSGGIFIT